MTSARSIIYLVGAGPGDPGLITVRGRALLQSADIIVFDRLVNPSLLTYAKPTAELIDAGKRPGFQRLSQDQINELLVDRACRGLRVVRLKGGDPFVFGRGHEELTACRNAGVDCVVVPGVTSAIAGPAAAGIPVTLRQSARSFAVLTAETASGDPTPIDFTVFSGIDTLVILMGRAKLQEIADALIAAGRDPQTPAACIERATLPNQRVEVATLSTIADAADRAELSTPMITVVGDVAALADAGFARNENGLAGKRIVVTRPRSTAAEIERRLTAAGATSIRMPLIRIAYHEPAPELDAAIAQLSDYRWVVFSSVHGVRAFNKRLKALGRDARALGGCRIAAVGGTTARELNKIGLIADIIPTRHTGADLAGLITDAGLPSDTRILFPRGNLGGIDLCSGLRAAGAVVDDPICYTTQDAAPTAAALDELHRGVDAILFFSPSAVRQFTTLGLNVGRASVGCVGPATAEALRSAGLSSDIVAARHDTEGLMAALEYHYSQIVTGS